MIVTDSISKCYFSQKYFIQLQFLIWILYSKTLLTYGSREISMISSETSLEKVH